MHGTDTGDRDTGNRGAHSGTPNEVGTHNELGARNEIGAETIGVSVQAGAIHGDVHLHQPEPTAAVPRQLPSAGAHFVNRAVEQDVLTTLLGGAGTAGDPSASGMRLATVDGLAGVGKSTLVVHWAHRMRERFPDGELYLNLRGFDPLAEPVSAAEALATLLAALDVPAERIPDDLEARAALFRTTMHQRRMLVLLDNARDTEQIRPLLPGNSTTFVIVTSRNRFSDLVLGEGATRIALDVLDLGEAHELLGRYFGTRLLETESAAVRELVEHCAGLPLALHVAAVRAAEIPDGPLAELVTELRDERERLDALDSGGKTGIRAVFSWSYRSLSPQAARLFRLLGLPTGPDLSLPAIAALAGRGERETRGLLAELTGAHLVESASGHYRCHDLLRAYAAECAGQDEDPAERLAALRRLFDHYLRTSRGIRDDFLPHIQHSVPAPDSEVRHLAFDDVSAAFDWWDRERANIVAAIRQASTLELLEHAWQLAHSMMTFFHTRSLAAEWISCHTIALDAARRLGERKGEAYLLHELGVAHHDRGELENALGYWENALALFEELDDPDGQSTALVGLGHSYIDGERITEATRSFLRVYALAIELGDRYDQGQAKFGLGRAQLVSGRFAEAIARFEECLLAYEEVGETYGRGFGYAMLGDASHGNGSDDAAVDAYRRGLDQFRALGHRLGESICLRGLASSFDATGSPDSAARARLEALAILDELGHPDAEELRNTLRE